MYNVKLRQRQIASTLTDF